MEASSRIDRPTFQRTLMRRIATSNPFYAISAALVVFGLRATFVLPGRGIPYPTLTLLFSLASYTLLLAATAAFLVRLGNVWEDVRTLLLLVVALLLASSVFLDDILEKDPRRGVMLALGSWGFSIALSEGLLRSIRLVLPMAYRIPYHLFLALFFLYPASLSPLMSKPGDPALLWGLFGFTTAAGMLVLSLIPAIRLGARYIQENGSPWPWPWYPWSLFAVFGIGVGARSYSLCLSVHYTSFVDQYVPASASIFSPYFLVPFLIACSVLLLEAGIATRRRGLLASALISPFALMLLSTAGLGDDGVSERFLGLLSADLGGSPLYLATLLALGFLAYAMLRRVPMSLEAFSFCLAMLSVIGPESSTFLDLDLDAPRGAPLWAASVPLAWTAIRQSSRFRGFVAAGLATAAVVCAPSSEWIVADRSILAFHLMLGLVLLLLSTREGVIGRFVIVSGLLHLCVAGLAAITGVPGLPTGISLANSHAYPWLLAAIVSFQALFLVARQSSLWLACDLLGWVSAGGWQAYFEVRRVAAGFDQISLGLLFFLLAAWISLAKARGLKSSTIARVKPTRAMVMD